MQILVTNLDYSDYFGRIAICRVYQGTLHVGEEVNISKRDGSLHKTKITKLFTFSGLKRTETEQTVMGDIIAVAGVEGITIGETITNVENPAPLPLIIIDEPTIAMQFSVNNSPFAGREGQYVTSRNLRDRLDKELLTNVSIRVEETESADAFKVLGRGELQLAILIEMMRREGFELMVGRPEIVTKMVDGVRMEPVEHLTIDVPEEYTGVVIEKLGPRKGEMTKMHNHGSGRVRLEYRVPSRGVIGLRSEMLTDTRGTIVMNSIFDGYMPYQGEIPQRPTGALIADRQGATTTYSLNGLQERGVLFLGAGVDVYEGMIVGEHSRDNDLDVNVVRERSSRTCAPRRPMSRFAWFPTRRSTSSSRSSSSPTMSWSKSRRSRFVCARRSWPPTVAPSGGKRASSTPTAASNSDCQQTGLSKQNGEAHYEPRRFLLGDEHKNAADGRTYLCGSKVTPPVVASAASGQPFFQTRVEICRAGAPFAAS